MTDKDARIVGYKLIGKLPVPMFDILEWARWFETADRIVAKTEVGPITVSTIFIGVDHGWGGKTRLFETMCFGARDVLIQLVPDRPGRLFRSSLDYQDRYETWGEAEAGHAKAVEWAKAELAKLNAVIDEALSDALPSPDRAKDGIC